MPGKKINKYRVAVRSRVDEGTCYHKVRTLFFYSVWTKLSTLDVGTLYILQQNGNNNRDFDVGLITCMWSIHYKIVTNLTKLIGFVNSCTKKIHEITSERYIISLFLIICSTSLWNINAVSPHFRSGGGEYSGGQQGCQTVDCSSTHVLFWMFLRTPLGISICLSHVKSKWVFFKGTCGHFQRA